jgi:hypothetical protein
VKHGADQKVSIERNGADQKIKEMVPTRKMREMVPTRK